MRSLVEWNGHAGEHYWALDGVRIPDHAAEEISARGARIAELENQRKEDNRILRKFFDTFLKLPFETVEQVADALAAHAEIRRLGGLLEHRGHEVGKLQSQVDRYRELIKQLAAALRPLCHEVLEDPRIVEIMKDAGK